jgi:hypothetical protein
VRRAPTPRIRRPFRCPHNDQCIYASDRDAEINVGHEVHCPPKQRPQYQPQPTPGKQSEAIIKRFMQYDRRGSMLADFGTLFPTSFLMHHRAGAKTALANPWVLSRVRCRPPGTGPRRRPRRLMAHGRYLRLRNRSEEHKAGREPALQEGPRSANLVASGIGVGGVAVAVHKDPAYGWHPTVMTAPAQAIAAQLRAEQVAKELRERFILAD